jgi:hypothetical protein
MTRLSLNHLAKTITIAFVLIMATCSAYTQSLTLDKKITTPNFRGKAIDLIETVGKTEGLAFSYTDDVKLEYQVTTRKAEVTLKVFLDNLFDKQTIEYKLIGDKIILIPGTKKANNSDQSGLAPLRQTIRGTIVDFDTKQPLPGVTVLILGTSPPIGTITNSIGAFVITDMPVGRHNIQLSYIGYETSIINEILVTSGKETVVNASMKESSTELDEVTVVFSQKGLANNSMASVSARSFSVEEARRYAGGMDDPARLASSFAGITMSSVSDNAIVIRGNSSKGILWKLEGISIPNPNHFPDFAAAGGGFVTVFSSQMLANSDFYTGAFPAEYGNALAGVFDIKFRNGNNQKREYTFQGGLMGLDFSSEGPLKSGGKASYLFNYRYSTPGLIIKFIPNELPIPIYQDVSFKLNFPVKNGNVVLWGLGSVDRMEFKDYKMDSLKWETVGDRIGGDWKVNSAASGLSYTWFAGTKTYLKATLAGTGTQNNIKLLILDESLIQRPNTKVTDNSGKIILSTSINHKFSPRLAVKLGVNHYEWMYNLGLSSTINNLPDTYQSFVNEQGSSRYTEGFFHGKYNLTPSLLLNAGFNSIYFNLNGTGSFDPRVALSWKFAPKHSIGIGLGKHSQLEELKIYLLRNEIDGLASYPNKNLAFSKALHSVLAYDYTINENLRLKIEPYYQYLYDIPGVPGSTFSLINFTQDYSFRDSVANIGQGRNFGIDITFERFLKNGYYYLITGSVFSSKFAMDDGIWRSTKFDRRFVSNILFGKEFINRKSNIWGVNGRLVLMGGERFTPVLCNDTRLAKTVIYDHSRPFEVQMPSTAYLDLSVSFRRNKLKYSSEWSLQVKNVLGTPFYTGYEYYYKTNSISNHKEVQIFPTISYKIEF